jgi:Uma2 family endonuclease
MTTDNNLAVADWEAHNPPADLIFDDGEPLESNRHRIAMNILIRSLQQLWSDRNDYFTGGNMFIYYSSNQIRNRDFRGPDFFAVLNVDGSNPRQGWVVWEENGRYPDVIVELMSRSTAGIDKGIKKDLYEQTFHTSDYFVYDPFDVNSLQGWHLDHEQQYQPLTANENGWLWCRRLGLWLGTWEGTIDRETAIWARFYDVAGNLVLLPEEAAKSQAEVAKSQAEAAKLQAEAAKLQAEAAKLQAEAAKLQAEAAKSREEEAQVKAARLAARLRELGENPDML